MSKKKEILEYLRSRKDELSAEFNLSKIGLFGSYALENHQRSSGIDILVEFEPNTSDLFNKKSELKKIIASKFGSKVEILREKYIKNYFSKNIFNSTIFV